MSATLTAGRSPGRATGLADEVLSLFAGAAITLGLFLAMSHLQHGEPAPVPLPIEDLRAVALPPELPPPAPVTTTEVVAASADVTGLEIAAAESPVRITVNIPILEAPAIPVAPPAIIRKSPPLSEIRPKMDLNTDFQRVFQLSEVDQRPGVLINTMPLIPPWVRQRADALRVNLLMVVNIDGKATDIRVLDPSGNPQFDAVVVRCVQEEWVFTPAVRKGRRVRCLVQRAISFKWNSSPFEN